MAALLCRHFMRRHAQPDPVNALLSTFHRDKTERKEGSNQPNKTHNDWVKIFYYLYYCATNVRTLYEYIVQYCRMQYMYTPCKVE